MIKKIAIPLTISSYNDDSSFNLLAYYKYVLNFSGEIIFAVQKLLEEINLSYTPISDTIFFEDSLFEPCCRYFANINGNDNDYYAIASNNIIIQKFGLDNKFEIFAKFKNNLIGFNFNYKIDNNIFIAKKKIWKELNSYYDILKNNFSIYKKVDKKILFEKMISSIDCKVKNINKLEFMKYDFYETDYLNNQLIIHYHKPNYLYFEKGFSKYKQMHDILFDKNSKLVYSWKNFCGKFV